MYQRGRRALPDTGWSDLWEPRMAEDLLQQ